MSNPFDRTTAAAATATATAKPSKGDVFDTATETGDVTPGRVNDPFSTPSGTSDYRINDFVGEVLLVKPTEDITDMVTEIGTTDAVRVDLVPLTGHLAGKKLDDILVFQMALKRALRKVLDGGNPYLLGKLTMGAKKPGKNAPYIFDKPTEEDKAMARAWLASDTL